MQLAIIHEANCVGCAKCLPVCPVDAIIGAPKLLHSILTDECIGCGLCVAPCPMDCIEMIENPAINNHTLSKKERAHKAKLRYKARQKRLALNAQPKLVAPQSVQQKTKIKEEIKEAIERIRTKKFKDNASNKIFSESTACTKHHEY